MSPPPSKRRWRRDPSQLRLGIGTGPPSSFRIVTHRASPGGVCRMRIAAKSPLRLLFFFLVSIFLSLISADEFTVASHPTKLQLPPGQPVERSPGSKAGSVILCNRVNIRGLLRLRHLNRFAHSVKVKVAVIQAHSSSRIPTVEICFHRNATIGVGMCPAGVWEKAVKGSWVQSMSPYDNKILDLCIQGSSSSNLIEVSTEEEFLLHRVIFLITGIFMMILAHVLSESLVFYYGSAMTLGVFLVILVILYQGMRLLPTNRKSSLAIFMYSSIVGVATFLLQYLSGLLRSMLVEIGISEDMHNPLAILFLVCLTLAGAWLGFWGVRKLVLAEDGSVDKSVAYFVEWSILIFAASMILQSSLDILLALEALLFGIAVSAIIRSGKKLRFLHRLYRGIAKRIHRSQIHKSPSKYSDAKSSRHFRKPGFVSTPIHKSPSKYSDAKSPHRFREPGSDSLEYKTNPFPSASFISPVIGSRKRLPRTPLEEETYYSTFHNTPDRKSFSKEEWRTFTRDSTTRAMKELSSSPDFALWVAANAERIAVTPPKVVDGEGAQQQKRRRLYWF